MEKLSWAQLVDVTVIVVMAAIWAVMPGDGVAFVTYWFYNKVIHVRSLASFLLATNKLRINYLSLLYINQSFPLLIHFCRYY